MAHYLAGNNFFLGVDFVADILCYAYLKALTPVGTNITFLDLLE